MILGASARGDRRGYQIPKAGVTGGCKLSNKYAKNQTWNSKCS